MNREIQQEKARQLRADILKMLYFCQSGYPGGSLSRVEIFLALYYSNMKIDPKNPQMADRDRFVPSKGHACPTLYAVLADRGFLPREDLWTLRQYGSHLQGHPDMRKTMGVDCNTGSLGQGVSTATGTAVAAKYAKVDYKVYVPIGDGEMQEGLVQEAAVAVAHYRLDSLTVLLDFNHLQVDGSNNEVMEVGSPMAKYESFGLECFRVNGHDVDAITQTLKISVFGKPKFICCSTHKGQDVSFIVDQLGWHGKVSNKDQYIATMKELGVEVDG